MDDHGCEVGCCGEPATLCMLWQGSWCWMCFDCWEMVTGYPDQAFMEIDLDPAEVTSNG